jgi:fructose-1,6-bisphosphatase/sedoheptulose 1,7-bisphosphatase-like protein
MEYAAVTERVALRVARLEGSGAPERAYTLATEAFREELERVPAAGTVAILREQRTDERGKVHALKTRPGILSVGDTLGGGRTHTVVMTTEPRVVRFVDTIHALEPEVGLQGFQL